MSHCKPYPAYRDSGVEWLGMVPEHWQVKPLKRVLRLITERAGTCDWQVALENIEGWTGRFSETESEFSGEGISFNPGDILFGKLRPYLAKAYVAPRSGEAVGDFFVLRPIADGESEFLHRYILTPVVIEQINAATEGAKMPRASWDDMGLLPVAIPERDEQIQIAQNLDRETARIDALVAKKTRFIELLREKRQALITHAVTKGLDPNVKMKDSGVEWLGEVPEHWELLPLKYVTPSLTVGVVVNPSDYVAEEGLPFLYGGDIGEGEIYAETARRISQDDSERNAKTRLMTGDLVTVRVGAPGVTAVVPPECEGGNCASVMLIRRGHFESDWLCYVMNSRVVRYQVEVVQYGAAQEQFNISHAVDFLIPVPPREEQAAIAFALNQERKRVDALLRKTEHSITLLKERRAALITAAVTGQIDLRETA